MKSLSNTENDENNWKYANHNTNPSPNPNPNPIPSPDPKSHLPEPNF